MMWVELDAVANSIPVSAIRAPAWFSSNNLTSHFFEVMGL